MSAVQHSLIETIYRETAEVHQRITRKMEETLGNPPVLERYRAILERMYGLYWPLERQFNRFALSSKWQALAVSLEARKKAPLIQRDLVALGMPLEEQDLLPLCTWPTLESEAGLLGALWVVEGATMGGQVTAGRIEACFGDGAATAFFRSYGPERVRPMWEGYCQALNAFARHYPQDIPIILQTAVEIFLLSEQWLFTGAPATAPSDPENMIAAESTLSTPGMREHASVLSSADYIIVYVSDMERSVVFYRDVLGLPVRSISPGWTVFNTGSPALGLHLSGQTGQRRSTPIPPAGQAHLSFLCPDKESLFALYEHLVARGVQFLHAPMLQRSGLTVTVALDPDGFGITLSTPPV